MSLTFMLLLSACLLAEPFSDQQLRASLRILKAYDTDDHDSAEVYSKFADEEDDGGKAYEKLWNEDDIEDILEERRTIINKKKDEENPIEVVDVKMPGVSPQETDTYLCFAHELPKSDRYIVKYEPAAKMQIAHHMLMYGCNVPFKKSGHWNCREMQPVCGDYSQQIVYAWGKNAPALEMPDDVGVHVGGKTQIKYLVLQVHYLDVSAFTDGGTDNSGVSVTLDKRGKKLLAGIHVLAAGGPPIPPGVEKFHMDMGCRYRHGPTMTAFRFRVHAHSLGSVITGYRVRDGDWKLIGRQSPQKPQAFYPTEDKIEVKPGDLVMGRCTYNSTKRTTTTYIGARHTDEMCNFYMMYYYDPASVVGMRTRPRCGFLPQDASSYTFPSGSDELRK